MAKVGVRGHLHQDLLSSIRACYVIPLFYSYRTIPEVSVVEVTDTANLLVELVWRLAGDIQARLELWRAQQDAYRPRLGPYRSSLPQLRFSAFLDTTNQFKPSCPLLT